MSFSKIWERYFLQEFCKVFFLFLFCFYGLYVLIDYASHTSALPHHQVHIKGMDLITYYAMIFSIRAEVLVPLALIIALLKTLISLNTHGELVALMASGYRLKTLMRPFILLGLLCTLLIFLNEQYVLPTAMKKLRRIEDGTKAHKHRKPEMMAHRVFLEDGSLFLYQSYDTSKDQFFDAYWIPSFDDIYRIKYLSPSEQTGYFVDHLTRQQNGELALKESLAKFSLPEIKFDKEVLQSTLVDPSALSLTQLWEQLPTGVTELSEKQSRVLSAFYWKLTLPWLCLLAIIAPIPFCVHFSRQYPVFLVYVCGIFGLIGVYLFMDAAAVVAKRQVLDPFWALVFPFGLIFGCFSWKYKNI